MKDVNKNNIRTATDLRFILYQHGELVFPKLINSILYGAIQKNNAKKYRVIGKILSFLWYFKMMLILK